MKHASATDPLVEVARGYIVHQRDAYLAVAASITAAGHDPKALQPGDFDASKGIANKGLGAPNPTSMIVSFNSPEVLKALDTTEAKLKAAGFKDLVSLGGFAHPALIADMYAAQEVVCAAYGLPTYLPPIASLEWGK